VLRCNVTCTHSRALFACLSRVPTARCRSRPHLGRRIHPPLSLHRRKSYPATQSRTHCARELSRVPPLQTHSWTCHLPKTRRVHPLASSSQTAYLRPREPPLPFVGTRSPFRHHLPRRRVKSPQALCHHRRGYDRCPRLMLSQASVCICRYRTHSSAWALARLFRGHVDGE